MTSMNKIPYKECHTAPGCRAVIEAAAGTGKTHNITNIAARIIMEREDVTIDKMVIVTFTRAAAGELKTRISQRLANLENLVNQAIAVNALPVLDESCSDPELAELIELIKLALKAPKNTLEKIRQRLRLALLNFDQAMIGTIHSFAMRSLSENSFSGKLKFGFSLNEGTSFIIKELCNDFCRSVFYEEALFPLKARISSANVEDFVCKCMANPEMEIIWPDICRTECFLPDEDALKNVSGEKEKFIILAKDILQIISAQEKKLTEEKTKSLAEKQEILKQKEELLDKKQKILTDKEKDLNEKKDKVANCQNRSQEKKDAQEEEKKAKEEKKKANDEKKLASTEKDQAAKEVKQAQRELDNVPNKIKELFDIPRKYFYELALEYVSREYKLLCEKENFLGNDDLILEMEKILYAPGSSLAEDLRKKYLVGLIDEFQDTNESQFAIFSKVFLDNPDSTFIVVGDPRQAIYRFRHGDIQCYLKAKGDIKSSAKRSGGEYQFFSMDLNRRSGKKYIEALNPIFTSDWTFAMDGMKMLEQSAMPDSRVLLMPDGKEEIEKPVQAGISDDDLEKMYEKCAEDIEKLVKSQYRIPVSKDESRPVRYEDIAILINSSWAKGAELKTILQKRNIPVRLLKNPNVFATPEAEELLLFLEGILNNNNRDALYRALVTPLGDLEIQDLKQEKEVEERAQRLQELNELWHKRSFMVMFNELNLQFRVYDRLSALPGGERSLSNFSSIADILAEEAFTLKLTPGAVLRSLQKHILLSGTKEENSYPGRPETDEGSVVINNIFGSKGLKYPVVFLPDLFYVGHSFNNDKLTKTFHLNGNLCFAPLITDDEKEFDYDEIIQESLRKTYVAFTRAQYFCRFYCTEEMTKNCSPLDWLFREHDITGDFTCLNSKIMEARLALEGSTEKKPLPLTWGNLIDNYCADIELFEQAGKEEGIARPALRRPDLLRFLLSQSGYLSFSSITPHNATHSSFEDPDKKDEGGSEEEQENVTKDKEEKKDIPETLRLPSGTNFGNAIHKILEICAYDSDEDLLSEVVSRQLSAHGISSEQHGTVTTKMLFRMLNAPIDDGQGGSFKLAGLDPAQKKCEFEFLYKFEKSFRTNELFQYAGECFSRAFGIPCPELTAETAVFEKGFFNGSIDLFFKANGKFYIVDWKTNKLDNMAAYENGNLKYAMAASSYYLQYMIYTVALFKYLKQRLLSDPTPEKARELYENNFGGVRYIFLRGATGKEGSGVFSARLPWEELEKLEEIIGKNEK